MFGSTRDKDISVNANESQTALDLAFPLRILVGCAFILIIALTTLQVFARSVFDSPLIWSEEVVRLLLVWMVFIGAAVVVWDGRHLNVDVVFVRLPRRIRQVVRWVNRIVALTFLGAVAVTSWELVMLERFSEIGGLTISMSWVRVPATLGCALMLALLLARILYRNRIEPTENDLDPI